MKRRSLSRMERVRKGGDFDRVHRHGVRARGRFLTLLAHPNDRGRARLGITASRKLGGAVVRNRAKRLVREIFRRNKPAASVDLVVIPRSEFLEAEFKSLEADYRSTLRRCVSGEPVAGNSTAPRGRRGPEGARRL